VPVRKKHKIAADRRRPRTSPAPPPDETLGQTLAKRVKEIAFGLILLGAGLGPLAPTIEGSVVLRLLVQTFFILGGMLWVFSMALEGRVRLRRSGVGMWLALLAIAAIAATINSANAYSAMLAAFMWLSSMAAFLFIYNEVRSRKAQVLLLAVIVASACAVSLHGLHQVLVDLPRARAIFAENPEGILASFNLPPEVAYDFEGRLGKDRIFGTFLLPNSLAGFLVLVFPVCVGILLDWLSARRLGESRLSLLLRGLMFLPLLLALYLTKSKGGWLAFAVSLGAFVVWAFGKVLWRRRLQTLCTILCLLIVGAIAQFSGLLTPLRDYGGSSRVRYGYWRSGVAIIRDHPVLGVGLDNFADYYGGYKRAGDQEARRAHNDYVQIGAEMGLMGLLLYLLFWAGFWRRVRRGETAPLSPAGESRAASLEATGLLVLLSAVVFCLELFCGGTFRTMKGFWGWTWPLTLWLAWLVFLLKLLEYEKKNTPARATYTTIGIGCGLVAFLAHSLVDFDHYVGGILQTAWIMMALLLAARSGKAAYAVDRKIGAGWRFATAVGVLGVTLGLLYGFVLPIAEAHVRRERATDRQNTLSLEERRENLLVATQRNPWDAQNHALLADVLLAMWRSGRQTTRNGIPTLSEAINHVREAIKRNPMRSEYHTRLGRLYELEWRATGIRSDLDRALAAYRRAEALFPSRPDALVNLGRVYDLAGRYDFACGKYFRAIVLTEEQYHLPRQLSAAECTELNERIKALTKANTTHVPPPPLKFDSPRLLGWPEFAPAADRGGR